jgi:2-methylcitrate dehydratase PrpD
VLIYERPASPLEGKFSMPFCAAAAVVDGRVALDTFSTERLRDERIAAVQNRVRMRVDPTLDPSAPPLTQASVRVTLRSGRELHAAANGARGYPDRPANDEELAAKFLSCAMLSLAEAQAHEALAALRDIERAADVRAVMTRLRARALA